MRPDAREKTVALKCFSDKPATLTFFAFLPCVSGHPFAEGLKAVLSCGGAGATLYALRELLGGSCSQYLLLVTKAAHSTIDW